jgi:phospholipid/cholesterol/gamma-HCH transport system substrate-binding protein
VPPDAYPGNAEIFNKIEEDRKKIAAINTKLSTAQDDIADLQQDIDNLKLEISIVEVQLDIRPEYLPRIREDSEVSIGSRGLIGDSFIDISPGTREAPPPKQGEFYLIKSVQRPGFREIMTGANDVVANFGVLSNEFKNIVQKFNPERLGNETSGILQDVQKTLRQMDQTFRRASLLIDDLHNGQGSLGRLVSDPELYERLTQALEKFNGIAEKIQSGNGTIAKLINDPSVFDSAHETLERANLVMDRIEKGEGTLGKLSKDEALYDKTKEALENLAALAREIDEGKGTLGKLLKDPGLYNNLDQSSAEISKLLYDLRQDPKKYLTIRFRIF